MAVHAGGSLDQAKARAILLVEQDVLTGSYQTELPNEWVIGRDGEGRTLVLNFPRTIYPKPA